MPRYTHMVLAFESKRPLDETRLQELSLHLTTTWGADGWVLSSVTVDPKTDVLLVAMHKEFVEARSLGGAGAGASRGLTRGDARKTSRAKRA